jgi:hypothetical protein
MRGTSDWVEQQLKDTGFETPQLGKQEHYRRERETFESSDIEANLHFFSDGCEEIDRMLLFRDWLRTHEDVDCFMKKRSENWQPIPGSPPRIMRMPSPKLFRRFWLERITPHLNLAERLRKRRGRWHI